ncbi:helix-turn-helix domain-containing protein [Myroides sp. LJL116]
MKIKNLVNRAKIISSKEFIKIQGINIFSIERYKQFVFEDLKVVRANFYVLNYYSLISNSQDGLDPISQEYIQFIPPTKKQEVIDQDGFVLVFTDAVFINEPDKIQLLYELEKFSKIRKINSLAIKNRKAQIHLLFQLIEQELQYPYNKIQKQMLSNYLYNILLICKELIQPTNVVLEPSFEIVKRFKNYVHQKIYKNRSIIYYASALNVSVSTLETAFKKHEYITPKAWLSNLIVADMKQKVLSNEYSTKDLALLYGFTDVSNFVKFFKKHFEVTPKQFRQQNRENESSLVMEGKQKTIKKDKNIDNFVSYRSL